MKRSSCNFLSATVKIRIIATIKGQTFNWCKLAGLQLISADAKNKVSSHSTLSMSDGCLCPLVKQVVVRGWFPHRQPAPCCPWNTAGSLSRGQEQGINTDSPWYPKNGGGGGSSASVDKERTLDSSAASAALLRGYISSEKMFFFSPKKKTMQSSSLHPKWFSHVWGFRGTHCRENNSVSSSA